MAQTAYIRFGQAGEPMSTIEVPVKTQLCGWRAQQTSCGPKEPTSIKALVHGRWRRVYQHGHGLCVVVDGTECRYQHK